MNKAAIIISMWVLSSVPGSMNVFSQTASVTALWTGTVANGCCNLCGGDYWCINTTGNQCGGNTTACANKIFTDPVPAGNYITAVAIVHNGVSCGATSVPTTLNGVSVCATSATANCVCVVCNAHSCIQPFGCLGISGYIYGGSNTLTLCPNARFCVANTVITFTYSPLTTGPGILTWNGSVSTDWFQRCNWTPNYVPNSTSDVVIPGGTTFQPSIGVVGAQCNTLALNSTAGAILTIIPLSALTITQ